MCVPEITLARAAARSARERRVVFRALPMAHAQTARVALGCALVRGLGELRTAPRVSRECTASTATPRALPRHPGCAVAMVSVTKESTAQARVVALTAGGLRTVHAGTALHLGMEASANLHVPTRTVLAAAGAVLAQPVAVDVRVTMASRAHRAKLGV
jgi:hypothetical protein